MTYIFNNQAFKNKKEVDTYIKQYIKTMIYDNNTTEILPHSDYFAFFKELLNLYSNKSELIGPSGIQRFCFIKNEYNLDELHLVRGDNTDVRLAMNYSKITKQSRAK